MKKTETKSTVLLRHHLKSLKLPTMHEECEKIANRVVRPTMPITWHSCCNSASSN